MSTLKSSWSSSDIFSNHIKPYALKRFPDASMVLLCGSQARELNGEKNNLPTASSDFDFIVIYDELPKKYPAAMFACELMEMPETEQTVHLDFKIMDRDYLQIHAEHTRNIRRFPFLFRMILDAYPLVDKDNSLPSLKRASKIFLSNGPADLRKDQIQELRENVEDFIGAFDGGLSSGDCQVLAYEGVQFLSNAYLRSHVKWESSIDRNLMELEKHVPGKEAEFILSFNRALQGDMSGYRNIGSEIFSCLDELEVNTPDVGLSMTDDGAFALVEEDEQIQSDANGMRIMLNQYLEHMREGERKGEANAREVESIFWLTLKRAVCLQSGEKMAYGKSGLQDTKNLPFDGGILDAAFDAMIKKDHDYLYDLTNIIMDRFGGVDFSYLERVYTEDLGRRRLLRQREEMKDESLSATKNLRL